MFLKSRFLVEIYIFYLMFLEMILKLSPWHSSQNIHGTTEEGFFWGYILEVSKFNNRKTPNPITG